MTTLENNKIELREIGDNDDLLEIVIKNQFWFKYNDVKKSANEFERYLNDFSIPTDYFETKEEYLERILNKIEIKYKETFGYFEGW
jgi:hypothetical protein